ncbi:hypothetical protein HMPREF9418_2085 [Neisseria macacae ATCC 33926]|uniref:Uncharacterized protein n=1 Tax=Neisseria macacae ATCC 33926 TaxID=997348 RepID=A0AA36UI01_9NEIS|nr:hypothetical protein HMPREF9418_2085 [Neisseria macacae ATCC 33926]
MAECQTASSENVQTTSERFCRKSDWNINIMILIIICIIF